MALKLALSLSHDGIDLLRNGAAGWSVIGQAHPSSEDLNKQMAALRAAADPRSGKAVPVAVLLPNDQMKYLSLDTAAFDEAGRTALVRQTLEDSTPYSVDEIVFDARSDETTTHVAAVARETLGEAESFARQFGFAPEVYVAEAPDGRSFALSPEEETAKPSPDTSALLAALEAGMQAAPGVVAPPDTLERPTFVSRRQALPLGTRLKPAARAVAAKVKGFAEPAQPFEGAPGTTKTDPQATPEPGKARARTETERMSVFGTRGPGQTRKGIGPIGVGIGLASVAALGLIAFAGSALGTNLSSFFALLNAPKPTAQFTAPLQPQIAGGTDEPTENEEVELVSLTGALSDEDQAVLDALRAPIMDAPTPRSDRTTNEMRAAYAATGIWPLAPDVPTPPPLIDLDNLYQTSVDPIEMNFDAVALPDLKSFAEEVEFLGLAAPAPAGTTFKLDERGFVIPTAAGVLNPDGVRVFAGPPPLLQPRKLVKLEDPGEDLSKRLRLSAFRPQARPDDLIETSERAALGGLTRSELGQLRPKLRPASAQETALAAASLVPLEDAPSQPLVTTGGDLLATATAQAVPISLRPDARPLNFAAVVEQTRKTAPVPPAATQVAAAGSAPRITVPSVPSVPSSASVSREATVKNALNLRRVNLIGVYGKPTSRRALVRLSNGRYLKVEVGDRIDGGRVSAIGDAELRYQKSGRDVVLKMPQG